MSNKLDFYRRAVDRKFAELSHVAKQVEEETELLEIAKKRQEAAEEARQLIQAVAETVQASACKQVASIVTRCLKAVFKDEAYTFRVKFSQKRGKTEAELRFERDGMEIDPVEAAGLGCVDVASFALRLSSLMLTVPKRRRVLILDEPFKFLSKEFRPRVRRLMEKLASEMCVQIIMVTHSEELVVGKVVEL